MTNEEKAKEVIGCTIPCSKCKGAEEYGHCVFYNSLMKMAKWKDSQPISAETFKACIQMLNETCYEDGTGVEDTEIEFTIKQKKLR